MLSLGHITLGAMGDSYYEYLLKLQLGLSALSAQPRAVGSLGVYSTTSVIEGKIFPINYKKGVSVFGKPFLLYHRSPFPQPGPTCLLEASVFTRPRGFALHDFLGAQ